MLCHPLTQCPSVDLKTLGKQKLSLFFGGDEVTHGVSNRSHANYDPGIPGLGHGGKEPNQQVTNGYYVT